ncbi:MAG: protease inhibitor I42 family protein [Parvularculaceae bacterium]|nr:protease inhibitor I42 family protein [Parvularculaceae bacterium]
MRFFAVVAFVALAACASGGTSDGIGDYQSLAAPAPNDVALKIPVSSDGRNVTVKKGTKIAVELVGTPTAGYLWRIVDKPAFLEPAGEYGGPTSSAQLEPGFAGGNHWEAFLFNVTATGEGELRFQQGRAWEEGADGDGAVFSVYVFAEE